MLDSDLVQEAMKLEIAYMRDMGVYEEATADQCKAEGLTPIGTRWILVNKGDVAAPMIRARLVAQETKRTTQMDSSNPSATFVATPPLEALRLMLSMAMTGPRKLSSECKVLGFFDISRAQFHSDVRRRLAIRLPKEDSASSSGIGILRKAMYGTKDAAQCFDLACEKAMEQLGFKVGLFNPCLYYKPDTGESVFRHGDDFIMLGTRHQIASFKTGLSQHMIVKHLGTLGPTKSLGDVPEIRCLNRIIRWINPPFGSGKERIEYEADPRHGELLIDACGLHPGSKGISTPSERTKDGSTQRLGQADHTHYRSCVMRACYLALDRPDLQHASKELARQVQAPTVADLEQLKRLARYLVRYPRVVQDFHRQERQTRLLIESDSDHAGCLRTRRSTSSSKLFHGTHLIRSSSTTQTVLALSSGESEFYAAVKAGSVGIGAVHMMEDLGLAFSEPTEVRVRKTDNPKLEIKADATAGIGVAMRRGAGRIRHIATPTLWLQKLIQDQVIKISKVPGALNRADLGTKHLDHSTIVKHMTGCRMRFVSGTSSMALKAQIAE